MSIDLKAEGVPLLEALTKICEGAQQIQELRNKRIETHGAADLMVATLDLLMWNGLLPLAFLKTEVEPLNELIAFVNSGDYIKRLIEFRDTFHRADLAMEDGGEEKRANAITEALEHLVKRRFEGHRN